MTHSDAFDPERLDEIEDTFLQRMSDGSAIAELAEMARLVAEADEEERARDMLDMLDEELKTSGRWGDRLELLRAAGRLVAGDDLHEEILETIRRQWPEAPSRDGLIEKVGLHRAPDDIPKTWKKVEKVQGLLAVDVGATVLVEGKGAGKVIEANLQLDRFKVLFENKTELSVGFGGAGKLLRPLDPDHILRRRLENPDELARLATEDPGELARIAFESYDGPRTGAEMKKDLVGPVPEKKWSSWWTSVRKLPQLVAATGRRNAWQWAGTHDAVQDAVRESFEAADSRQRLELLRRNLDRDAELLQWMDSKLVQQAESLAASAPALACEVWIGMERLDRSPPADAAWSPETLLGTHQLSDLASGIEDRARREHLCLRALEKSEHIESVGRWLSQGESDLRAVETVAGALGEASPSTLETLIDRVLQKPASAPALFVWVAEKAGVEEGLRQRHAARLLPQMLFALGDHRFGPWKTPRLEPLFEAGGTVARMLAEIGADQARGALGALERSASLAGHLKTPLLNALLLRFPDLREEEESGSLYATADAIARKKEELRRLREEDIPANRQAIQEARELGDLRENFEYKSARQRHEYLSSRVGALANQLSKARPIDFSQVSGNEVVIGCRIELESGAEQRTLTILGPWNSDPENHVLSNESDLARTLLGKPLGAKVEIDGETWTIRSIEPAG